MEWVDRLVTATGWDAAPGNPDWAATESSLGAPLPEDFKELSRRFAVRGAFCDHVMLLEPGSDPDSLGGNHAGLLSSVRANPDNLTVYRPYSLFGTAGGGPGLLQWGYSLVEDEYYWLADPEKDSSAWPVAIRADPLEPFHVLETSATEFLYRVLTDRDFHPFTIADRMERPYFQAY